MKVFVEFKNVCAEQYRGLSFDDIEDPHDAGSPRQVDVKLVDRQGKEKYLGTFERADLKRLASAVQL